MTEIELLEDIRALLQQILAQLSPVYEISYKPKCNCALGYAEQQRDKGTANFGWWCPVHGWMS